MLFLPDFENTALREVFALFQILLSSSARVVSHCGFVQKTRRFSARYSVVLFWLRLGPKLEKRGLRGVFLTLGNHVFCDSPLGAFCVFLSLPFSVICSACSLGGRGGVMTFCFAGTTGSREKPTSRMATWTRVRRTPTSTSGMGSCVTSPCKHHHQATITMQTSSPSNHHHANLITKQPSPCKHDHQATITMQTSTPSNHHHANINTKQPSPCKHHHQATITMQTSTPSNHHHANIITKQPSP